MKIVIISSDKWIDKCREDKFLMNSLINAGIACEIDSWEHGIKWDEDDLLILRSPWDYYENYDAFRNWLCILKNKHIRIANGVNNILVNIDKKQQFLNLSECKLPMVPYLIADSIDLVVDWYENSKYQKVVIKPTISASGHDTYLIESKKDIYDKFWNIVKTNRSVIIQPFVENINKGEVSLIYFHGIFSHGVIRYPGIIGQKKIPVFLTSVDTEWLEAGEEICKYIGAEELLYVRIDLVKFEGKITIMEIELSEPDLYFTFDSSGSKIKQFISEIKKEMCKDTPY